MGRMTAAYFHRLVSGKVWKIHYNEDFKIVKTFKKVMAMLIVGIVTFITPVNVFAMPNTDDGIMTLGYGQSDSNTVGFSKSISVTILPNVTFNVGVNGEILLNYEWDEGYD